MQTPRAWLSFSDVSSGRRSARNDAGASFKEDTPGFALSAPPRCDWELKFRHSSGCTSHRLR